MVNVNVNVWSWLDHYLVTEKGESPWVHRVFVCMVCITILFTSILTLLDTQLDSLWSNLSLRFLMIILMIFSLVVKFLLPQSHAAGAIFIASLLVEVYPSVIISEYSIHNSGLWFAFFLPITLLITNLRWTFWLLISNLIFSYLNFRGDFNYTIIYWQEMTFINNLENALRILVGCILAQLFLLIYPTLKPKKSQYFKSTVLIGSVVFFVYVFPSELQSLNFISPLLFIVPLILMMYLKMRLVWIFSLLAFVGFYLFKFIEPETAPIIFKESGNLLFWANQLLAHFVTILWCCWIWHKVRTRTPLKRLMDSSTVETESK